MEANGPEIEEPLVNDDSADDREPGASATSVFITADSVVDLEAYGTNAESKGRSRLPSGLIAAIKSGEDTLKVNSYEANKSRDGTPNHTETESPSPEKSIDAEEEEEEEINYLQSQDWRRQRKHIFVLSSAGKPIYCRYGEEDKVVTLMGVLQALVSFVQDGKDSLRCICAGEHKFVFMARDNLIIVTAARSHESQQQLLLQLNYVYNQIISVLTYSQLQRVFKQRHNYDLRRLLTGAEKFLDNLMTNVETDYSCLLGAVTCLPLENSVRESIGSIIAQNAKMKDLVFALLFSRNQLISLVRMKKYTLHPMDLHLIFNLVNSSESFKTAESWTPMCLPKFDSGGYLHAYISYVDPQCNSCLMLLSVDRETFFNLSDCKQIIQEKLLRQRSLQAITDAVNKGGYSVSQAGIADLRHFLYKSKRTCQFTCPRYEAPYVTAQDRARLFELYQCVHARIHSQARPLRILYHVGNHETIIAWVTSGFELYAVFGPLVSKSGTITAVDRLIKWIKKQEDRLFIMNSPTF